MIIGDDVWIGMDATILDFTSKVGCKEKNIIFNNYKDYNYDFNTLFLGAIFDRKKAIEIGGFNISSSYI